MNFPKRLNQTKNMFYQSIAPQDLKVRINRQVEPERESLDEQLGYWLDMKKPAVKARYTAMYEAHTRIPGTTQAGAFEKI